MSLNKNCFLFIQVMQRNNLEKMDIKTSPVSLKCQRGSLFVVGNIFVLVLVNLSAATPLFSPSSPARAALFGLVVYKPRGRKVAKPKICRKAPVIRQCTIVPPCHPELVSNGKSHLVMDPSDVARRIVECNLRVVWHGSQRVNLSVSVYVYVCM
jgi:hypothetical protein